MQMSIRNIFKKDTSDGRWSAEKISSIVLLSLTGVIAFVFLLFYFVGYDAPAVWDERYVSPMLTDLLLVLMILLLLAVIVVVVCSKVHSMRTNHAQPVVNGIRGRFISSMVICGVALVMLVSCFALPVSDIVVNGELFSDTLWLRMANMFVVTCLTLIVAGVVAIVFGIIRNRRK